MQNITAEKLKADAARLGFHKKPMDELVKMVKASITDEYQSLETKLYTKKNNLDESLDKIKGSIDRAKAMVGETVIDSGALLMAMAGLTIGIAMFIIGKTDSITTGVIYLCISVAGAVFVRVNPSSAEFWKPILFVSLSLIIGAMQTQISFDQGFGLLRSIIFGISLAIMSYLLNEILFRSFQSLKGQMTAIWHRLKDAYLGFRKLSISKSIIKVDKRIDSTLKRKEMDTFKSISCINYEYKLAELASEIKNKDSYVEHYQVNRRDVKYAN